MSHFFFNQKTPKSEYELQKRRRCAKFGPDMELKRIACACLAALFAAVSPALSAGAPPSEIAINTRNFKLELVVDEFGSLLQKGFGPREAKFPPVSENSAKTREFDFYPAYGNGYLDEPAIQITHADGNVSTQLAVEKVDRSTDSDGNELVAFSMKDAVYDTKVELFVKAFPELDIFQMWTKISNAEEGPVTLYRYASASPLFCEKENWLTQFHGGWANEMNMSEEKLTRGVKVLDSKMGVRAHKCRNPMYILSLGGPAKENSGTVFIATLMWPGAFNFTFDFVVQQRLRTVNGINHFGAQYVLDSGESLETPKMLYACSSAGTGRASRNLHAWGRLYGMRDAQAPRPVLLNNWEATYFNFDEAKLDRIFDLAKPLGIDVFLLDDGWFGNRHARNSDKSGLGDWEVSKAKLPNGLERLCRQAADRGFGFGIWLEPEMVNPRSQLYEEHPDWVITVPRREIIPSRFQMILDNTRPQVRDFEWGVFEKILRPNPICYVKWDANRHVNQPGSLYLPARKQTNLTVDYNNNLLAMMRRFASEVPKVGAMLCAGGGGRVDYASLANFTSFWASDNTDPVHRVRIQWGYSYGYPSNAISAHVTNMGRRPLRFAINVALGCAFGIDMDLSKLSAADMEALRDAVQLYKNTVRPLTSRADLYRLESPYAGARSAVAHVLPDKSAAIVFAYQLADGGRAPLKIDGLDAEKKYRVEEISLPAGAVSKMQAHGKTFTGRELAAGAAVPPCEKFCDSSVILLSEVK